MRSGSWSRRCDKSLGRVAFLPFCCCNKFTHKNPTRLVTYVHDKSVRKGQKEPLNKVISVNANGGVKGWVNHRDYTGFIYTDLFKEINEHRVAEDGG